MNMVTDPGGIRKRGTGIVALLVSITAVIVVGWPPPVLASGQLLGATLEKFAVLGGSTVINTGPTQVNGDLGVSPGTAVTGFPPGQVTAPGTQHSADAVAAQAQSELTTTYNTLAGRPFNTSLSGQDLGGMTLLPGVYNFNSDAQLTGTLTLDTQGNPNAVFIFQVGHVLTTAANSSVVTMGNPACEVYWQVGSSATMGSASAFLGNLVALTSITMNTNANLAGRALARNGAVTLDRNQISPQCPALAASDQPITATHQNIAATEGSSFSGAVATFTDPDTTETGADYTATIDWGDGAAATTGTIARTGAGAFTVSGAHAYAEEGSYTVTASIADADAASATVKSTATVADAALTASCALGSASGLSFSGSVVTLTDADPKGTVPDYAATINWGDGSSSTGTISGSDGGPFTVSGSHTYASAATFTISTNVLDAGGSTAATSCTMLVDQQISGKGRTICGGTEQRTKVATFTDPDPRSTAAEYSASINWGDGHASTGLITRTATSSAGNSFRVAGAHGYSTQATFVVRITITDIDNAGNGATVKTIVKLGDAECQEGDRDDDGGQHGREL